MDDVMSCAHVTCRSETIWRQHLYFDRVGVGFTLHPAFLLSSIDVGLFSGLEWIGLETRLMRSDYMSRYV